MIRFQHILLFLVFISAILFIWFPSWNFSLGFVDGSENPMVFELKAFALTLSENGQEGLFSFDALKPKYWYINSIGHILFLFVSLFALFHLSFKGDLNELIVQSRWIGLTGLSILALAGFIALQVFLINSHFDPLLGSATSPMGVSSANGLFLKSEPSQLLYYSGGFALFSVLAAFLFVQADIRRIQASNRIR